MTTSAPFVRAGVIGHPIHHSKSPLIHNHWIARHGLHGEYRAIDIAPENLAQSIARLVDEGYAGFNVTIPHKQAIFDLCEEVDETARSIGAVNTVVVRNGKLRGTNTDAFGFMENLHSAVSGWSAAGKNCAVLGAGGAARAVVYGLLQEGAAGITITNRTPEKAQEIALMDPVRIKVAPWEERANILDACDLLVNTTALGMSAKAPLEIDLERLPLDAVVTDIVYAPLMTELLERAHVRGNVVVTGIGMLLHQARPAFEKWFGVLPDVDEALERIVLS